MADPRRGNVLFVTLDQVTMAALQGPMAGAVPLPAFDRLAARGVRFDNHCTVTLPCGPARASLLTGLYAMNHRAIRNGTPLARHHATVATEARKAGYEPLLFGYSDISPDPDGVDPEDPILASYEGVAPGFRELVEMRLDDGLEWPGYLRARGHAFELGGGPVPDVYRPAGQGNAPRPSDPAIYSAEESDTAYLTDRTLAALDIRREAAWFAHVTYIRPHPPLVAPAPWNRLVDPATLPAPDRTRPDHPFLDAWFSAPSNRGLFWGFDGDCAALTDDQVRELRAVYLGLLAEVDHHLGRLLDWLDRTGQADRTLVIVTADHGEMLGDKAMWGKESVFDPAFRVPLWIVDPAGQAGSTVALPTESVDLAPTILDWIGRTPPAAMDGRSLLPLVRGAVPGDWRAAQFLEADLGNPRSPTRFQRALGLSDLQTPVAILRGPRWKYVHFGGGVPPMLYDLQSDPGETRDLGRDPAHVDIRAGMMAALIDRMTERRDRRQTHILLGA